MGATAQVLVVASVAQGVDRGAPVGLPGDRVPAGEKNLTSEGNWANRSAMLYRCMCHCQF